MKLYFHGSSFLPPTNSFNHKKSAETFSGTFPRIDKISKSTKI
nr:MAG TPA: hypothetical protein [Caudoviricetes sp.]